MGEKYTGIVQGGAIRASDMEAALDTKAPLASPALTGTPTAPTAAASTNNTQIATTAFVTGAITTKIPNNLSSNKLLYWNGTKLTSLGNGNTGEYLISNGADALPSWGITPTYSVTGEGTIIGGTSGNTATGDTQQITVNPGHSGAVRNRWCTHPVQLTLPTGILLSGIDIVGVTPMIPAGGILQIIKIIGANSVRMNFIGVPSWSSGVLYYVTRVAS